jgi:hypothetical protein
MLAHRALERDYASFDRVLIRRDFSSPYRDHRNREINCIGLLEGDDLYKAGIGLGIFHLEPAPRPGWKLEILAAMEWSMIISFAGPFAAAQSRNSSRRDKRWTALFSCGASNDYTQAEAVLADYKVASKQRYGLRHFEERAWELVETNQPAISALASELLQHEMLEYEEAHKIAAPLLAPVTRVWSPLTSRRATKQQVRGQSPNINRRRRVASLGKVKR